MHNDFKYDDAALPLRQLLSSVMYGGAYKRPSGKYEGPEIESTRVLCVDHNISDGMKRENLTKEMNLGRDAIDVFIRKVFQLGYSVGFEECKKKEDLKHLFRDI